MSLTDEKVENAVEQPDADPVPEVETDPEILIRSSELEILRAKAACYDSICEIGKVQAFGQQLAADLQGKERKLAETLAKRN